MNASVVQHQEVGRRVDACRDRFDVRAPVLVHRAMCRHVIGIADLVGDDDGGDVFEIA